MASTQLFFVWAFLFALTKRSERVARTIAKNIERDDYRSEAVIVWCNDARFWEMLYEFVKLEEYRYPDLVVVNGRAKDLASDDFRKRDYVSSQILASINNHQTRSVILMMHADCEAYQHTFYQDTEEIEFYTKELQKAKEGVQFALGGDTLQIRTFFADFYGLTEFYT